MIKKNCLHFVFILLSGLSFAQTQIIPLQGDTSGYLENNNYSPKSGVTSDVIPTIKGELNINSLGALTYNIPIEVFKGVNNFQPNLALAYSSDSGNGQAGYGWNLVGLSVITQGGKSKKIDGIYEGAQFNDNDPYYLDGQRLIQIGNSQEYQTEHFSHIKITKLNSTNGYTFLIKYPDGKIAKYKKVTIGQHSISLMEDGYGNQINYNYTTINNTPYIDNIEYGKISGSHPFKITFIGEERNKSVKIWRKGLDYLNTKVLKEVQVSSIKEGLHRKYVLTHDITSLGNERLRTVEVYNGNGDKLKPLLFKYNPSNGRVIEFTPNQNIEAIPKDSEKIGGVTMGDFYGDGEISSVFWVTQGSDGATKLWNSKNGPVSNFSSAYEPSLYSGKIIQKNGKFSERDQLIEFSSQLIPNETIYDNGLYFPKTKVTIKSKDLKSNEINEVILYLKGSYRSFNECEFDYDNERVCYESKTEISGVDNRYIADFNNDGLIDILIAQKNIKGSNGLSPSDSDIRVADDSPISQTVFIEIGKYLKQGGEITSQILTGQTTANGQIIEFDGDGTPELLEVDKTNKWINIYKLNFGNNTITRPLVAFPLHNDFSNDTPLIFGDFNGDGLTDFIVPQKVFKIDKDKNLTPQVVVNTIKISRLLWNLYLNKGDTFLETTKDFTSSKLAYIAPGSSYHHIKIHRSSFIAKLWSGTPDREEYVSSDFGTSSIIPVDINNDGKTDLVSFTKFGNIKFNGKKIKTGNFSVDELNLQNLDVSNFQRWHNSDDLIKNELIFHENISSDDDTFSFLSHNGSQSVSLENIKISPFSFFINSQLSNGLYSYQNKLVLYDPYTNKSHTFTVNSNNFFENQIQEIDNSSGVVQEILYTSLTKNSSNYNYKPQEFNQPYPFFIHKQVPLKFMVKRVNTLFDGKQLRKDYIYENAIQHLDGLGFLGFQKTYVSDVYADGDRPFWTVNTHDPTKENQLVQSTYGGTVSKFFSKTILNYQRFEKSNLQYLYLTTSETSTDYLKNITITKTHNYTNDLLLQSTSTSYGNVGSTISSYEYQPSWSSGEHFYHGRIKSTTSVTNAYGNTFSTKDEFSNFNNGGVPKTHEKYGNGTEALTTESTFDLFGNITSETISANGVSSLTTNYEYDETKRFVNIVTDPEGLKSLTTQNIHGWLLKEVSPLGSVTKHTYDEWGNPLNSTSNFETNIALTTTLVKEQLSDGKYSLSTITPGSPQTIVIFDKFDRQIKSKTQSINNKWVVVDTEYDVYGKKIKQSEPYFEGSSATLWNTIEYDDLDRPISQTMFNGKVATTCYQGLTVTVEDDEKKYTKTLDAMGNTVYHKDEGGEIWYSYYANGTLKEANYENIKIKIEQDGWGNKIKLDDPSAGIYKYEYDAFGRKLKEITPKGETTYVYDEFGKLLYESNTGDHTNINVSYEYNPTNKLPTKITGSNGTENFIYETKYDTQYPWRIIGKKEVHPQFVYETSTTFDNIGRADVITTKTKLNAKNENVTTTVKNVYDNAGILRELKNSTSGQTLWTIDEVNAKGLTTKMAFGNGFQIDNTYNTYYLPEKIHHYTGGSNSVTALELEYQFDNLKGLLLNRNNKNFQKNETFEYDALFRLTKEITNGSVQNQYSYDNRGRITHNTAIGQYEYHSNNYQLKKLNLNTQGKELKDNRGFADITYNGFKKAVNIHLKNSERIDYTYNLFKERTSMYYGSEDEDKNARPYRKYYSSDKAIEIKHNIQTQKWEIITYLDGDPYAANVLQKNTFSSSNTLQETLYLHRDYQTTILAISDSSGSLVEQRFFDAWGNLKEAWNSIDGNTDKLVVLDRGYTGHEHLQNVGLIHMNGRLYDAALRRFLSPDNFVQDPFNTQNFNRYGYVLNNPLMFTDPSGELFGIAAFTIGKLLLGVAVAVTVKAINNVSNGVPWWYGVGKSAVVGAVSAGISTGIGEAASNLFNNTFNQALFQAAAHAVSGGVMNVLEGGDFLAGFASGAVSSLISSGVQSFGNIGKDLKDVLTIASGGLSGGISSSIAGGNFWAGVRQGLITSGLNHVAHRVMQPKTTIVGIYGAGGKDASGNPVLRELVEGKGGTMFTSSWGGGDSEIIDHLIAGHKNGNTLKIYAHSRGGAAAVRIANELGLKGIDIAEINLYDPVSLGGDFVFKYNNVKVVNNYYQRNPPIKVWGNLLFWNLDNPFIGSPVKSNFQSTTINNINLTGKYYLPGQLINHYNITKYAIKNP